MKIGLKFTQGHSKIPIRELTVRKIGTIQYLIKFDLTFETYFWSGVNSVLGLKFWKCHIRKIVFRPEYFCLNFKSSCVGSSLIRLLFLLWKGIIVYIKRQYFYWIADTPIRLKPSFLSLGEKTITKPKKYRERLTSDCHNKLYKVSTRCSYFYHLTCSIWQLVDTV